MAWFWALPFFGLLLTIATGPLLFSRLWHAHYGKIAGAWAALIVVVIAVTYGWTAALATLVHALVGEYLSFIVLLFALYTVAGGILVTGELRGTPAANLALLATGTAIASLVGTTGAAMILIRPVLRALEARTHKAHVLVFFIILVANVGGALTPLGDPPLFVGFLRGVDFFWTARNLWPQTAIVAGLVLTISYLVDAYLYRREVAHDSPERSRNGRGASALRGANVRVRGGVNFVLIAAIVAAILVSAKWRSGIAFDVLGTRLELQNLARDAVLVVIALVSVWLTSEEHRAANGFSWEPIREVAKLFAAIFVAIVPVLAMLEAGRDGPFAWLLRLVTDASGTPREVAFFWLTGLLSSVLDNAPTYIVFFELAGGNPRELMTGLAGTLASISMGAVYMGALTYIGNAPNLMVYAIAEERGARMPGFFAYAMWAALILVPLFVLLTLLPVAPLLRWE
jgi:Na+/H+ antiporter NhaD/arsenite permease-like protein